MGENFLGKRTHPIDVHVGSRIRLRRMMMKMSQETLGEELDLTFQQVQKYEKGANRVGASRLYTIASILSVPVQFFFDDMPDHITSDLPNAGQSKNYDIVGLMDFVGSRDGLELNTAFIRIEDPEVRKKVAALVQVLAS